MQKEKDRMKVRVTAKTKTEDRGSVFQRERWKTKHIRGLFTENFSFKCLQWS